MASALETRSTAKNVDLFRPCHSFRPKIRITASGTDLITILTCFLFISNSPYLTKHHSFQDKNFPAKKDNLSRARSLVPRAASWIRFVHYEHYELIMDMNNALRSGHNVLRKPQTTV